MKRLLLLLLSCAALLAGCATTPAASIASPKGSGDLGVVVERATGTLAIVDTSERRVLAEVPGLRLLGKDADRVSVLSFDLEGIHPHDAGTVLDTLGVAVRAGHHCAQPLMRRFGVAATLRASFGAYNTMEEVDALVAGLHQVRKVLGG